MQNWRPLVNWLLAIPHLVVLYGLGIAAGVLWIVSFFTVLFTKRNPFVGFQAMVLRYQWRVLAYFHFMHERVSAVRLLHHRYRRRRRCGVGQRARSRRDEPLARAREVAVRDPVGDRGRDPRASARGSSRSTAFFVVLFTGKWPEGARNYVVGVFRWHTRVTGYVLFVTDAYPPFRLEP